MGLVPITLYSYQQEAIDAHNAAVFNDETAHVLEIPTGGGKTLTALSRLRQYVDEEHNAIFLVPRKDLVSQTKREALTHYFQSWEVGVIQGDTHEAHRPLTIATHQSLTTNPERLQDYLRKQRRPVDVVVEDECQYSVTPSHLQVFQQLQPQGGIRIGLSGTPYRADNVSLERAFPHGIAYSIDFLDLVLSGHLVWPEEYTRPTNVDFADIDVDEDPQEVERRQLTSNRYQVAYESWMELTGGTVSTLIFGQDVTDAYKFHEYFEARGVECPVIVDKTPDKVRESYYERLKSGDLLTAVGYNVFTTGNDIKRIGCIILGRATRFRGLFTQIVGRGLRTFPGKDRLILINLTDYSHTLLTMQKLIGTTEEVGSKPVNIKQKLEEKLEDETPSEEKRPHAPEEVLSRLKEIHLHATDLFAGAGWTRDRMTNDYVRDYGDSILRAVRSFTGYQVMHYLKKPATSAGGTESYTRPQQVTQEPLPADIAMARGNQYMERLRIEQAEKKARQEQHARVLDGTSTTLHEPITPGMYDYLINTRKLKFKEAEHMTQRDYAEIVNFLQAHKSAHSADGHHLHWTREGGVRTWYNHASVSYGRSSRTPTQGKAGSTPKQKTRREKEKNSASAG